MSEKKYYCQKCGKKISHEGYFIPKYCKNCKRKLLANNDWESLIKL